MYRVTFVLMDPYVKKESYLQLRSFIYVNYFIRVTAWNYHRIKLLKARLFFNRRGFPFNKRRNEVGDQLSTVRAGSISSKFGGIGDTSSHHFRVYVCILGIFQVSFFFAAWDILKFITNPKRGMDKWQGNSPDWVNALSIGCSFSKYWKRWKRA